MDFLIFKQIHQFRIGIKLIGLRVVVDGKYNCNDNDCQQNIKTNISRLVSVRFQKFFTSYLFGIDFRLKDTNIGKIAVSFVIIEPVAYHEGIRDFETGVICIDIRLSAGGLVH